MPSSRMYVPPVTQDLWPVLRDRISTGLMATILGGPNRVFVEGDYSGTPDIESKPWGRGVIVPVLPAGGTKWEQLLPTTLRYLFRTDFNDYVAPGYNVSRSAELAQREAARQWQNWDGSAALVSNQVMFAGTPRMDEAWQPRVLYDPDRTGTVFLSSSWLVCVASAAD